MKCPKRHTIWDGGSILNRKKSKRGQWLTYIINHKTFVMQLYNYVNQIGQRLWKNGFSNKLALTYVNCFLQGLTI